MKYRSSSILIIDSLVEDESLFLNALAFRQDILILRSHKDGVRQITEFLKNRTAVTSLCIVSHGFPGGVKLGSSELSLSTIADYTTELQNWFSTSPSPDQNNVLLYCCNVAVGDAGEEFLNKLHSLTGATIGASSTPVGASTLGGNWDIDYRIGDSENIFPFVPEKLASYRGILEAPIIEDALPSNLIRSTPEDTQRLIDQISITDVNNNAQLVTLTATLGTINLDDLTGITITGGLNGSSTVTFEGNLPAVNNALSNLYFIPDADQFGMGSLTISTDDNDGLTNPVSTTLDIEVTEVNDAPTITPSDFTIEEGGSVSSADINFGITDIDTDNSQLIVKVTSLPSEGQLRLNGSPVAVGSTFDYTQVQNGNLTYEHDGTQTLTNTTISDFTILVDDGAGETATDTINIIVTPVNQAPSVSGATELFEGEVDHVIPLDIIDGDQSGVNTVKILSLPGDGELRLNGSLLSVNDTLTGADFDNGLVTFTHDGNDDNAGFPPNLSFDVEVTDDGGGAGTPLTSSGTVELTILPNNDDPEIDNNTGINYDTSIDGVTEIIKPTNLQVTDPDSPTSTLTYTLTEVPDPDFGVLQLYGANLGVGSTFTQLDIDNDGLTYTYFDSGNPGTYTDLFKFTLKDGESREYPDIRDGGIYPDDTTQILSELTFNISVTGPGNGGGPAILPGPNASPVKVVVGEIFDTELDEGATFTPIGKDRLEFSDVDNTPDQLVYRITQIPTSGTLEVNGTALNRFGSFTQQDINDGLVRFVHAGEEDFIDEFTFTVSDGTNVTVEETFKVTSNPINDQPTVTASTVVTVEGATEDITTAHITLFDVDGSGDRTDTTFSTPNALTFQVDTLPSFGDLYYQGTLITEANKGTTNIPEAALSNGDFQYTHDGSENFADSFTIQANDTQGQSNSLSTIETVNVEIASLNDDPVFDSKFDLNVDEAGSGVIGGSSFSGTNTPHLAYTDTDNSTSQRQFAITTAPLYGTLKRNGAALSVGGVFTQADLDSGTVEYVHDGTENYADSFEFDVRDGGGNSVPGTYDITVNPSNDTPELEVPSDPQLFESDDPFVFSSANGNEILVDDLDLDSIETGETDVLKVTLDLQAGGSTYGTSTITLASIANLVITDGTSGVAGGIISIEGTKADVQAALEGLTVQVPGDEDRSLDFVVTLDDLNNGGSDPDPAPSGYSTTVTQTITLNASNFNDAPVITAPDTSTTDLSVDEEGSLAFTGGNIISVADPDTFDSTDNTVTLDVLNGELNLSSTSGVTIDGNNSGNVTLTGAIADINTALETLTYAPDENYNGNDTLSINVDDKGNTGLDAGAVDAKMDSATVGIFVTPVNDAPELTIPGTQTISDASPLILSGANAISIDDLDLNHNHVDDFTVTLTATDTDDGENYGKIKLSSGSGVSITGGADDSPTVTISGTKAQINDALDGLSYTPVSSNADTIVNLEVVLDDEANGGTAVTSPVNGVGAAEDVTQNISIIVSGENDAPTIGAPDTSINAVEVNEDTSLNFIGGNLLTITDSDDFGEDLEVTLSVTNGTLTFSSITGLNFTTGDGSDDSTMTFTGTEDDINSALATLSYQGSLDYNGPDTLSITVDDQGNTGTGGAQSTLQTVAIDVLPINDAPTFSNLSGATPFIENDVAFVLDGDAIMNDIDLNAFNAGNGNWDGATLKIERQLSASTEDEFSNAGTLDILTEDDPLVVDSTTIGTVTTNSAGTLLLSFNSNATNDLVDSVLQQITYRNVGDDPDASISLEFTLSDGNDSNQGENPGTGLEEPLTVTATKTINITRENDLPVVTAGDSLNYTEQNPAAVIDDTITIGDLDDTELVSATATLSSGFTAGDTLAAVTAGTNISADYNSLTGILTLTGPDTLANYQQVMRSVTFFSDSDDPTALSNTRTVTWSVTDANSDGAGAETSASVTSSITVIPVNDAPVLDLDTTDARGATGGDYNTLYSLGSPATIGDTSNSSLTDPDNLTVQSATITLTTRPDGIDEGLSLTNAALIAAQTAGISVSVYNSVSGVLTLSGTASKSAYEAAIAAITYDNTALSPDRSDRTVTVIVNDGESANNLSALTTTTISFDTDGDGVADIDDDDDDNDGIIDTVESTADTDGDGIPDHLDLDSDNDGISDLVESGQDAALVDMNNDGVRDDITDDPAANDIDGNGLADAVDSNQGNTEIDPVNSDDDLIDNYKDLDSDNDGIPDAVEAQPTDSFSSTFGNDGDVTDDDSDRDGIIDVYDTITGHGGDFNTPINTDGLNDGADYIDPDSDEDDIVDSAESGLTIGNDTIPDGIGDGIGASYQDPDGTVGDPSVALTEDDNNSEDVDYRSIKNEAADDTAVTDEETPLTNIDVLNNDTLNLIGN